MRGAMRWVLAIVIVLILCVICGCRVGSSAGEPANRQSDNGATAKNSIAGTVTFRGNALAGVTVTLFLTNNNLVAQTAE